MGQHAVVVIVSVGIAAAIGIGLGIAVYQTEKPANIVLGIAGTALTIPSFALFALLIPPLGLGFTPTVVALVIYALLPIVRNTVVGLRSVDPAITESARGMGMGTRRQLLRIELPLAWPVILAGLRVSTLLIVGIAAIGAAVDGPGLGKDIFMGLSRIGSATALNLVLGGLLGVVVLALLFDGLFQLLQRLTISPGTRGD